MGRFVLLLVVVGSACATMGATRQDASKAGTGLCFPPAGTGPEICVPLSVLQTDYAGYQPGDGARLHDYTEQSLALQAELAETLRQWRACMGVLAPLQGQQHAAALKQQAEANDAARQATAPPGMAWDKATRKYIPKKKDDQ